MSNIVNYNRTNAVNYAGIWALKRNPRYLDFSNMGGDCTNFISQCLYVGSNIMNYTNIYGWYYNNANHRSASWTGVEYLYNFLISNKKAGVFATKTTIHNMMLGDIIQLGNQSHFYHSLIVTGIGSKPDYDNVLVSTHSDDFHLRPLYTYSYSAIRFLHIEGVYI